MNFPDWISINDIKTIFGILSVSGESRLVGGCVRNTILGQKDTDIDIATQVQPQQVISALNKHNIKCIPTGIKHGTVTAILNGRHYEITTLRKDTQTNGRHAEVEFTGDWECDAMRRDFTINAMYMDLSGNIYDYFEGQKDLAQNIIRFVGNPQKRIGEDYLRILRYFRFYSYFPHSEVDKPSLLACRTLASHINELSGERIMAEMLKILSSPYNMQTLELMHNNLILEVLGMEIHYERFWDYKLGEDPLVNLAIILRCCTNKDETTDYIKSRWRLSNKMADTLAFLTKLPFTFPDSETEALKIVYKFGIEKYMKGLKLIACENPGTDVTKYYNQAPLLAIPEFPLSGDDLMELEYTGPGLGVALKMLEAKWLENNFGLSKNELLEIAAKKPEQW